MARLVAVAGLAGCSFEHGHVVPDARARDASIDAPPVSFHLRVEAYMDGRSRLIFSGNTLRWHHYEFAAPGREQFLNQPTKLDGMEWFPVWPDIPTAENRDCDCESSTFTGLLTAIPRAVTTSRVTIVQARRAPSIVVVPTADNDYTLIVELNDVGQSGSAWHIVDIDVMVN